MDSPPPPRPPPEPAPHVSPTEPEPTPAARTVAPAPRGFWVYVGGYGHEIHRLSLDEAGTLAPAGAPVDAGRNPSFVAVGPAQKFLFAANEIGRFEGNATGSVASFAIDAETGGLTLVDRVSSQGRGPVHVVTDATGRWLFVATYTEGNVAAIGVGPEGKLAGPVSVQAHGEGAQSHMTMPSPDNDAVFVTNRARDTIAQHRFDAATGALTPNAVALVSTPADAGPRHMDFHPTLSRAYVVHEDDDTIAVYRYDAQSRRLSERLQTISTLPADADHDASTGADIHVHPRGHVLYASNRGHDSIAVFAVDEREGTLHSTGHRATGGKTPRNFAVTDDGRWMLIANQKSNTIVPMAIDQTTGMPEPAGTPVPVGSPSVVVTVAR